MLIKKNTALILLMILFSLAAPGCVTRNYTDETGRQCVRKTKLFIFFVKSNYSCQPLSQTS